MDASRDHRNASLSPEVRTQLLLAQMTVDEKIGQMCQYVAEPESGNSANVDELVGSDGLGEKAALIRAGQVGAFLKVPGTRAADELQAMAAFVPASIQS